MLISRRFRNLTLALTAGCIPFTLALALHGQSSPYASPLAVPSSAPQVASELDGIIQPRFQDDRAGVFGTGRVVPTIQGHISVNFFQPETPLEKQLWAQATGSHRHFLVTFLHCAHVPGKFLEPQPSGEPRSVTVTASSATLPFRSGVPKSYLSDLIDHTISPTTDWKDPKVRSQVLAESPARQALLQQVTAEALPKLQRGQGQEKTVGNWLIAMRPVRASIDSCLSCHTGAKRGDTLGVMVYAVSSAVNKG